jgi:hypothetical protein
MDHQGGERGRVSPSTPCGFQSQHLGDVLGEIQRGIHEYGFMANRISVNVGGVRWRGALAGGIALRMPGCGQGLIWP